MNNCVNTAMPLSVLLSGRDVTMTTAVNRHQFSGLPGVRSCLETAQLPCASQKLRHNSPVSFVILHTRTSVRPLETAPETAQFLLTYMAVR
jgi:hypothetical protein